MQPLWMLSSSFSRNLCIFFFVFFNLIIKKTNCYLNSFNFFFFFKLKLFLKKNKLFHYLINGKTKIFLIEDDLLIESLDIHSSEIIDKFSFNKTFYFDHKTKSSMFEFTKNTSFDFNKKFYYKLLNFFFLNTFLPNNSFFPRSGFFNMFFFKGSKGSAHIINLNKVLLRWKDFFNLILNLYLFNLNPLVYSSPFFKNETLALNWNLTVWELRSWKYCYPFFVFKTNNFSIKTKFFYDRLDALDYSLFIISDCLYHFKNLYFFKKFMFYTIGLISLNISPWLVSYPILASSNSFLNQIFFLQALSYAQKKSFFLQFHYFKKIWNYVILKKVLN